MTTKKPTSAPKPKPVDPLNDSAGAQELAAVPGAPLQPVLGGELLEPASDGELEKAVEALPNPAPRLTMEHIQRTIVDEIYTRIEGTLTTVCTLKLRNGYTVVGVNNGPVSPENFDQKIACEYAYKGAVNQIWTLEGYLLKEFLADGKAKSDLNPVFEMAGVVHEVMSAYGVAVGGPVSPTWAEADDELQMRVLDRVAAVLRGDADALDSSTSDKLLGALVHALKAGRHG